MKRILFVCTGNTCRSPLAEGLGRKLAAEAVLDIEFRSAGVHALDGAVISRHSAAILREQGIEEQFSSSMLAGEAVDWADLILTMTRAHKQAVIVQFPHAVDKTFTLKEFVEDESALEQIAANEREIAELQLNLALGQAKENPAQTQRQLERLWDALPDHDISDPFGQSLEIYRLCAEEIEEALKKLLDKAGR